MFVVDSIFGEGFLKEAEGIKKVELGGVGVDSKLVMFFEAALQIVEIVDL